MDTYQLQSIVRERAGLIYEDQLGTQILNVYLNLGAKKVTNVLYRVIDQYLTRTQTQTVTGTDADLTGDVLSVIHVWRDGKACIFVDDQDEVLLGQVNYPDDDENNPVYLQEGKKLVIYPTMTAKQVKIKYRARVADLSFGRVTDKSGSDITLDAYAALEDDIYNDYDIAIYTEGADGMTMEKIYRITDWDGGNKVATLDSAIIANPASSRVWYSLVPVLPNEYHHLIIDACLIEMLKSPSLRRVIDLNLSEMQTVFLQQINTVLRVNQLQECEQYG